MNEMYKPSDFKWFPEQFVCPKGEHLMTHIQVASHVEVGHNGVMNEVQMDNIWECCKCGMRANIQLKG